MSRTLRLHHQAFIAVLSLGSLLMPNAEEVCQAQSQQPAAGQPDQNERTMWGVIDLDFGGGSATDFLNALRQATGGKVNIVVMPHVEEVPVPPMKLRQVSVFAAINLLDGESVQSPDRQVRLNVQPVGPNGGDVTPLVKINASVKESSWAGAPLRSNIWSVADLISGGMTADNITTAVSAALELLGADAPRAQVRFHKETSLLLARAEPEQIGLINDVIEQLRLSNAQQRSEAMAPVHKQVDELRAQLAEANSRMSAMEAELNDRLRAAESAKAKANALETMNADMRNQLNQREDQLRAMQMNLDQVTAELMKLKK